MTLNKILTSLNKSWEVSDQFETVFRKFDEFKSRLKGIFRGAPQDPTSRKPPPKLEKSFSN